MSEPGEGVGFDNNPGDQLIHHKDYLKREGGSRGASETKFDPNDLKSFFSEQTLREMETLSEEARKGAALVSANFGVALLTMSEELGNPDAAGTNRNFLQRFKDRLVGAKSGLTNNERLSGDPFPGESRDEYFKRTGGLIVTEKGPKNPPPKPAFLGGKPSSEQPAAVEPPPPVQGS